MLNLINKYLSIGTSMLIVVGVILAAAFFVAEWNDVTERLSWLGLRTPQVRPYWRRWVNVSVYSIIALVGLVMLLKLPARDLDLLDWVIVGMFLWSALSLLWATNRVLTIRSLGGWLSTGCAVFGVGLTCSLEQCVMVIAAGCLFYFIAGVVHEVCTVRFTFSSSYRFFGGVGSNRQAAAALLLLFITVFLYQTREISPWWVALVVVYTIGVILLAKSRTGTWSALAAAFAWGLFSLPSVRVVAVALGIGIATISFIAMVPILRSRVWALVMLGRKQRELKNLSGRTIIWSHLWPTIRQRPVFGSGYGSIWTDARFFEMSNLHPFSIRIAHAHSVYLDSLLNGGMVALLLFAATLGIALLDAVQMGPPAGPFIIGLVTYAAIHGLGESTLALPVHRAFAFFSILVALKG